MTTTIPTTSFVNVDAIVPPELSAECAAMVEKLEAFAPQFHDVLTQAVELWVRLDELEKPAIRELERIPPHGGDVGYLISTLTGSLALYDAFDAFGGFEGIAEALGRNGNGQPVEEVSK